MIAGTTREVEFQGHMSDKKYVSGTYDFARAFKTISS